MARFSRAFSACIAHEGGFQLTDVAGDAGGETYAGIARTRHPDWQGWQWIDQGETDSARIQRAVRDFYRENFWARIRGDDIQRQTVANSIFDFAVNAGVGTASHLAQETVSAASDGIIGPNTLKKINRRSEREFIAAYALRKLAYYADICTRHPAQKKFLLGWLNRTLDDAGIPRG